MKCEFVGVSFLDQKIKLRNGEKVQIFDVVELCLHVKME